ERVVKEGAAAAEVCVMMDQPIHAIQHAARVWAADLIVMARARRHTLDMILGSATERVIRMTQRPVLIVNNGGAAPYRNVVLATDLSKTSLHVARTVAAMRVLETAYTWIVHAFRPSYFGAPNADGRDEELRAHRQ